MDTQRLWAVQASRTSLPEVVVGRISDVATSSVTLKLQDGQDLAIPRWLARAFHREAVGDCIAIVTVDHMLHVSQRGEWMPWIHFFLQGVAEQCDDAVGRAKKLAELRDEYKRKLQRASGNVLALIDELCARPAISISRAAELLDVTFRAASLIVEKLEKAGILEEVTGRTRDRVYVASEIVNVIET